MHLAFPRFIRHPAVLCALALVGVSPGAWAQGFAAYITPPRFEVQVAPGQNLRQVVEIQHVGQQKGNYLSLIHI